MIRDFLKKSKKTSYVFLIFFLFQYSSYQAYISENRLELILNYSIGKKIPNMNLNFVHNIFTKYIKNLYTIKKKYLTCSISVDDSYCDFIQKINILKNQDYYLDELKKIHYKSTFKTFIFQKVFVSHNIKPKIVGGFLFTISSEDFTFWSKVNSSIFENIKDLWSKESTLVTASNNSPFLITNISEKPKQKEFRLQNIEITKILKLMNNDVFSISKYIYKNSFFIYLNTSFIKNCSAEKKYILKAGIKKENNEKFDEEELKKNIEIFKKNYSISIFLYNDKNQEINNDVLIDFFKEKQIEIFAQYVYNLY